jgi:regulator of RNase E activity RraB
MWADYHRGPQRILLYAPHSERLEVAIEDAMGQFRDYEFDCGSKVDREWRQYLDVLCPSDEDRQRIENRKVLEVLEQKNDSFKAPRDVWHWIYFRTECDRGQFRDAVSPLEYRIQSQPQSERSDFPFGLCIVRFQSVNPRELDDAVIELFRLAKKHQGDYDGWETKVISQ